MKRKKNIVFVMSNYLYVPPLKTTSSNDFGELSGKSMRWGYRLKSFIFNQLPLRKITLRWMYSC